MNIDINSIKSALGRSESVEWAGTSEPFKPIEDFNKKSVHTRWILSAVIGIVLIAAYCYAAFAKDGMQFQILVPVVIAAVAVYIALIPMLDAKAIMKKRVYIVTNKNILIRESESTVKSMALENIDEALFIDKGAGVGDILFGSAAIKRPYRKIRTMVLSPVEGSKEGEGIVGMAFYNIRGFAEIKSLLPETVKITEKSFSEIGL